MCLLCAASPAADGLSRYDLHTGASALGGGTTGRGGERAPYTWDQIANYLTDGYWLFNTEGPRKFDLSGGYTLTYDISRLSTQAKDIAEQALATWSAITGITFVEVGAAPANVTEGVDARVLGATTYTVSANSKITGFIASGTDVDDFRVSLVAGQTYVFALSGVGANTLGDGILTLLDSAGSIVDQMDNSEDALAVEFVTFTATVSGTYYIRAEGYSGATGSYTLDVMPTADISFGDIDPSGAYSVSDLSGGSLEWIDRSYVNVPNDWDDLTLNGYFLQTYVHEIGHALGLGHAGPYNGNAVWGSDNLYDNDSWSATVMSYFSQEDNPNVPGSLAYLASFMPADIIAIQNMYGASSFSTGDTVWGPGGNVVMGPYFQEMLNRWAAGNTSNPFIYAGAGISFTVYDTAGNDTLDFSAFTANQEILLDELQYSDIGGLVDNVVIARGVVIENAKGGAGSDRIFGNDADNRLSGGGAADTLRGGIGSDTLEGGAGADSLLGGGDTDFASYAAAAAGVVASLTAPGTNTGDAAGDIYDQIEGLIGSANADTLTGNAIANRIEGGGGNDRLNGGAEADTLVGDAGDDTLDGGAESDQLIGISGLDLAAYLSASIGVVADLANAGANTGDATGDLYIGLGGLIGSMLADTLAGDNLANALHGDAGADVLSGRDGADSLFGGSGNDTLKGGTGADAMDGGSGLADLASYIDATAGVRAELTFRALNTGEALGDTYAGIEGIEGSAHNDTLGGDAGGNRLYGLEGVDNISGLEGNDSLYGGLGNDVLRGGAGADRVDGGDGSDTASYAGAGTGVRADLAAPGTNSGDAFADLFVSIENLLGSNFNDTLVGNAIANFLTGGQGDDSLVGNGGNDSLRGGFGADVHDGGTGTDAVYYTEATSGLQISLAAPGTNTGIAAGDTFVSIEAVHASDHADTLTGNDLANQLVGYSGNDLLYGGLGDDSLYGGDGNDTMTAEDGADYYDGGLGFDEISYAASLTGLRIDMLTPSRGTGLAAGDSFKGFEKVIASSFNDYVNGSSDTNEILGGAGADTIIGNAGNDSLYGGEGNDSLRGSLGADIMDGGNGSDWASYLAAGAAVRASLLSAATNLGEALGDTYASIENLQGSNHSDTLTGDDGANSIYGQNGHDSINGNGGDDVLRGMAGNDTLTGGGGADRFVFNTTLGASNVDQITDFSVPDDTINLENAIFSALAGGTLAATAFATGAAATLASHRVIYDSSNGRLYYDADGAGGASQTLFAVLTAGLALTATDILVT